MLFAIRIHQVLLLNEIGWQYFLFILLTKLIYNLIFYFIVLLFLFFKNTHIWACWSCRLFYIVCWKSVLNRWKFLINFGWVKARNIWRHHAKDIIWRWRLWHWIIWFVIFLLVSWILILLIVFMCFLICASLHVLINLILKFART